MTKVENYEPIIRNLISRWNGVSGMNKINLEQGSYHNSYEGESYYLWVSYQGIYIFRHEVDLGTHSEEEARIILYNRFLETTFLLGIGTIFQSCLDRKSLGMESLEKLN